MKVIVGDRRGELAAVMRESLRRADLLVLTGGLGPTADDVTRQAVSDALGLPLRRGPGESSSGSASASPGAAWRCRRSTACRRRCCGAPWCSPNANGTAPGQWIEHGSQVVVLLPGPPREMRPMLEAVLAERLEPRAERRPTVSAGDQDRRADRVRRRTGDAAGLLAVRGVAAAGRDQHPGGAGPDRTALLGSGRDTRNAATRFWIARDVRDPGRRRRRRVQHRRTVARAGRRRSAAPPRLAHRHGRVVHRGPGGLAPDRRRRAAPITSSAASWPTATAPRPICSACREDMIARARRGQRAGRRGDGRRACGRGRASTSPSAITGIAGPAAARDAEAGRHGRHRRRVGVGPRAFAASGSPAAASR